MKKEYLVGELFGTLKTMNLTESERIHYIAKGKLVIPVR